MSFQDHRHPEFPRRRKATPKHQKLKGSAIPQEVPEFGMDAESGCERVFVLPRPPELELYFPGLPK